MEPFIVLDTQRSCSWAVSGWVLARLPGVEPLTFLPRILGSRVLFNSAIPITPVIIRRTRSQRLPPSRRKPPWFPHSRPQQLVMAKTSWQQRPSRAPRWHPARRPSDVESRVCRRRRRKKLFSIDRVFAPHHSGHRHPPPPNKRKLLLLLSLSRSRYPPGLAEVT